MLQNEPTPHTELDLGHLERQATLVSVKIISTKSINDQESQTVEDDGLLHGVELFLVVLGLACAVFLAALDQTIVSTALPKIVSDFNGLDQIAWVATSYLLTTTSFQPMYGKLSDIFGRKITFLFAIAIFEIGSLLCGIAKDMVSLIIYRAIAGIGGGGIIGLVLIIISDIVSGKDRGKYQGIVGACFGIASVAGPLMGGAFTDHITWRWCFFINIPLGVITILAIIFFLHMKKPTGSLLTKFKRIDFIGISLMISSTVCILLPLNWGGNTYPWDSPVIITLLCIGAAGYVIFGLAECYIVSEPIAPPTQSGLDFMPYILSVVVFSILSGQFFSRTDKVSFRCVTLIASALIIIGAGLSTLWNEKTGYGESIGYMIISGAGIGMSIQSIILGVQGLVEHKDIATVTTLTLFFRTVFGIAISGTVFNNRLSQTLSTLTLPPTFSTNSVYTIRFLPPEIKSLVIDAYVLAFQFTFYIIILYSALMLITALFMGNSKPKYNEGDEKHATFE
ncbi:29798_t:CDS:2 [Gigaspora margarita]|uniref:29798_t:CDS:1 n=1 Tax=Gigaspora margarita TaxID=4874 RepID=A0ABM8W552_GIGMA|nr:29798_t:CDS:2 [Gigaspora margarita]